MGKRNRVVVVNTVSISTKVFTTKPKSFFERRNLAITSKLPGEIQTNLGDITIKREIKYY